MALCCAFDKSLKKFQVITCIFERGFLSVTYINWNVSKAITRSAISRKFQCLFPKLSWKLYHRICPCFKYFVICIEFIILYGVLVPGGLLFAYTRVKGQHWSLGELNIFFLGRNLGLFLGLCFFGHCWCRLICSICAFAATVTDTGNDGQNQKEAAIECTYYY